MFNDVIETSKKLHLLSRSPQISTNAWMECLFRESQTLVGMGKIDHAIRSLKKIMVKNYL